MARWRTLNKRARRKRERDAQFLRDSEQAVKALEDLVNRIGSKAADQGIVLAFKAFGEALQTVATEFVKAVEQSFAHTPERRALVEQRKRMASWPDVVYEDILDAEYITEED